MLALVVRNECNNREPTSKSISPVRSLHLLCTDLCFFYNPFLPHTTNLENSIDVKSFIDVAVLNELDE